MHKRPTIKMVQILFGVQFDEIFDHIKLFFLVERFLKIKYQKTCQQTYPIHKCIGDMTSVVITQKWLTQQGNYICLIIPCDSWYKMMKCYRFYVLGVWMIFIWTNIRWICHWYRIRLLLRLWIDMGSFWWTFIMKLEM